MHDYGCDVYREYVREAYRQSRAEEVGMIRQDLLSDLMESPDYQEDSKRNGEPQPMVFTRGGEDHGYNVICLPGDELFAGDIIDAFGEKWIVMRVRADETTHRVGVMYQCNKLLRFQNFDTEIRERWSYIDVSGYSSAFNNSASMQSSAEQMVIYLPFDEDTEKIFVDKRLAINKSYDRYGRQMLSVLKVTGANPVAESFNQGDHLLMLKVERDLYDEEVDNFELEVCNFVKPGESQEGSQPVEGLSCTIRGRGTIRVSQTGRYEGVFLDGNVEVTTPIPVWTVAAETGVTLRQDGRDAVISIEEDDDLIGGTISLTLCAQDDPRYGIAALEVEVSSLV